MDTLYSLFKCTGDGDSYPRYSLISFHKTVEGAKEKAKKVLTEDAKREYNRYVLQEQDMMPIDMRIKNRIEQYGVEVLYDLIHPSMTEENNYIYIGKRDGEDFKDMIDYGAFGGFIIEEQTIES